MEIEQPMNHISLGLDAVTQHRKVCGNDYMKKKMSQQLCKASVVTNTGKKLSLLSCTQYSSQLLPYSSQLHVCTYAPTGTFVLRSLVNWETVVAWCRICW